MNRDKDVKRPKLNIFNEYIKTTSVLFFVLGMAFAGRADSDGSDEIYKSENCYGQLTSDDLDIKTNNLAAEINTYPATKKLPQDLVDRALSHLTVMGHYFKTTKEAVEYYAKELSKESELKRTFKVATVELLLGALDDEQTSDYETGAIVSVRFYTKEKAHNTAVTAVAKIFGARAVGVDTDEFGVIGVVKKKGQNNLKYFEPHFDYFSEYGTELLDDSNMKWKTLELKNNKDKQ